MIKDLVYLQLGVFEPEKTCKFLMKHFGFFKCSAPDEMISPKQGFLICNSLGDKYLLTYKNTPGLIDDPDETIAVGTDDCLRDYHLLNTAGIRFERKPQYTRNGLEALIADEHGNRYKLIERRDYSEI